MDHKDRRKKFKRERSCKSSVRHFIIYVEGQNTEKSYFDLLKKSNCKVIPVTKRGHGISRCVDFVNESEMAWNCLPSKEWKEYDERWLVFDADGRADFADGIRLAREKGFRVAFSNMCIEYWFMLHFYDHDGRIIPMLGNSHSKAQIQEINKFIKKYNKKAKSPVAEYDSGSKKVEDDFFDLMLAIDPVSKKRRIVVAFERAKAIHETKKANGAEFQESVTTVYELLAELGVIEEKEGGYVLFQK